MTWLHTWAGLVFCWLLYFMFVTGTLGYLDTELDQWMKPEMKPAQEQNLGQDLSQAVAFLQNKAPDAERWFISPANHRDNPQLRVSWHYPRDSDKSNGRALIDQHNGEELEHRDTAGGQTLYRMHYRLHYLPSGWGFRLTSIFTLAMFIALLTGVVAHRKLFKDFFSFRPQKGKAAWLDMHNVTSIASLPFQLMITYSGLIFAITTWMPFIGVGAYDFDVKSLRKDLNELRGTPRIEASGESAELIDMHQLANNITAQFGSDNKVRFIEIRHPGDRHAKAFVRSHLSGPIQEQQSLQFNAVTAQLENQQKESNALEVRNTFINLHEGLFAGPGLRLLYILSGLLGCIMVATGAIYYAQKRRREKQAPSRQQTLLDILNGGTIVGLPIAICGFMLANRLLPITLEDRADWEVHCLFLSWLATFAMAGMYAHKAMWHKLCLSLAICLLAVPLVNYVSVERGLGQTSLESDPLFVISDWVFLGLVGLSTVVSYFLKRKSLAPSSANQRALQTGQTV